MFEELFSASVLSALFQVIMIDLVLAGDNAIVIGLAAAGLPTQQRGKVIFIGIAAATVLRIVLAMMTTQLLAIVGLLLAGGVLLLWVSWKMWRELHHSEHAEADATNVLEGDGLSTVDLPGDPAPRKTFRQAVWQIVVADLSMSLDNVLAVGGAAREHPWVLVFGLALSIALMAIAATFIARLLQKHRWIGFVGLFVIDERHDRDKIEQQRQKIFQSVHLMHVREAQQPERRQHHDARASAEVAAVDRHQKLHHHCPRAGWRRQRVNRCRVLPFTTRARAQPRANAILREKEQRRAEHQPRDQRLELCVRGARQQPGPGQAADQTRDHQRSRPGTHAAQRVAIPKHRTQTARPQMAV